MKRIFNSKLPTIVSMNWYNMIYVPTDIMEGTQSTIVADNCEHGFINVTATFISNTAALVDVRAIHEYQYGDIVHTKVGIIKTELPEHIKDIGNGMFEINEV